MSTTTPAIGTLRTPPVVQGSVIALRTAGKSKRSIAKELGISRETVDNVLEVYQTDQPNYATTVRELTSKAFGRVTQAIENEKDTDTARWALERTVFKPEVADQLAIHGDVSMQAITAMIPSQASTTGQPSLPSSTSTSSDPSSQKAAGVDASLSLHTNFSETALAQLSTADLEAELERRRRAEVIDVQAEPAAPRGADNVDR